jgi:Spy/CpxP family protein refolding chaperone
MRKFRWVHGGVSGLVLIAGLGLAACDKGSSSTEAPGASASAANAASSAQAAAASASAAAAAAAASAEAASTAAADEATSDELRDYHRHHHHGGVTMFVSLAVDTLGLDPAKKAQVEKIQTDLNTKMAPARDAEHDLLATIADGVAAGTIDTKKVDAAVAKLGTASAGIHNTTMDALTQLHDALSPIERATLVDKVKAHWDVWRNVNSDEKLGSKDKGTHLARLADRLSLTPDQVDKISKALATETADTPQTDTKPVDAHIQAFATAFVADKFDPKALAPSATAAAGHVARHGGARLAHFYEAVTPVLTPEQRTKLAAHLRERLNDQHASST